MRCCFYIFLSSICFFNYITRNVKGRPIKHILVSSVRFAKYERIFYKSIIEILECLVYKIYRARSHSVVQLRLKIYKQCYHEIHKSLQEFEILKLIFNFRYGWKLLNRMKNTLHLKLVLRLSLCVIFSVHNLLLISIRNPQVVIEK